MTIEERADAYVGHPEEIDEFTSATIKRDAYIRGAKEQKSIDEKYIKLLEEDRNAFIAFCHNIINGKYISVIDAAKEQLSYLENKVMEE